VSCPPVRQYSARALRKLTILAAAATLHDPAGKGNSLEAMHGDRKGNSTPSA
jgi:hypothetical protein